MMVVIGLAIGLILAGMCMAIGSKWLGDLLGTELYWVGVALIVIGLIFLLSPVIIWINGQLHAMIGH